MYGQVMGKNEWWLSGSTPAGTY